MKIEVPAGLNTIQARQALQVLATRPDALEALLGERPFKITYFGRRPPARNIQLPYPPPDVLMADVKTLLETPALLGLVKQGHAEQAFLTDRLLIAWNSLPETHRYVLRRLHGLDGLPRDSQEKIAEDIGRNSETVRRFKHQAVELLREALWPTHGFAGMTNPLLRMVVKRAEITEPFDLPRRINDLFDVDGFGTGSFQQLCDWLTAHGYEELISSIREGISLHNRLKYKVA
jgi:hypothetical protein